MNPIHWNVACPGCRKCGWHSQNQRCTATPRIVPKIKVRQQLMHAAFPHGSPCINYGHYNKLDQHAKAANRAIFL